MSQQVFTIAFDNIPDADANRYASGLRESILDATSDVEVNQRRDNPYTQDFGATLLLVLGTPAVLAVARAIGNWLTLHRQVGITIKTAHGEIIGTNLTSKDATKLAELLLAQKE